MDPENSEFHNLALMFKHIMGWGLPGVKFSAQSSLSSFCTYWALPYSKLLIYIFQPQINVRALRLLDYKYVIRLLHYKSKNLPVVHACIVSCLIYSIIYEMKQLNRLQELKKTKTIRKHVLLYISWQQTPTQ